MSGDVHVHLAEVHLAGLHPVAAFIASVCRADAEFQCLTHGETSRLPGAAARGLLIIREAVAALGIHSTAAPGPAPAAGPWPPGYETKDPNVTVRPAGPESP